ncbi:MAG: hypothetical protein R2682_01610 [Pyrinomonadaceae bacterium]
MKQTYIKDLKGHIGETVTLKAGSYNKRSRRQAYVQLRDGGHRAMRCIFPTE